MNVHKNKNKTKNNEPEPFLKKSEARFDNQLSTSQDRIRSRNILKIEEKVT